MAWNKGAQPATPKRHILVAVTGNTPQIVTETLYVLAVAQRPPVPISAVYILTTARGAEIAWAKLGGEQGAIAALQRHGWRVKISWECDLKHLPEEANKIAGWLAARRNSGRVKS